MKPKHKRQKSFFSNHKQNKKKNLSVSEKQEDLLHHFFFTSRWRATKVINIRKVSHILIICFTKYETQQTNFYTHSSHTTHREKEKEKNHHAIRITNVSQSHFIKYVKKKQNVKIKT